MSIGFLDGCARGTQRRKIGAQYGTPQVGRENVLMQLTLITLLRLVASHGDVAGGSLN
jgi:hypothetical protein